MNSISWFLYLAEVLGRLGTFSSIVAFMGVFFIGGVTVVLLICNAEARESKKPENIWGPRYFIPMYIIWSLFVLIAIITPSKDTFYLIAGSEITEVVVNTPEAKEVLNETREAILRTIKGISKE